MSASLRLMGSLVFLDTLLMKEGWLVVNLTGLKCDAPTARDEPKEGYGRV